MIERSEWKREENKGRSRGQSRDRKKMGEE